MRDDVRWYFPGLCGVSERTVWHSGKASATAFLMFPYARRTMLVLRLSQYGVVSDGCVFGLFVPLPWPVLIGFTQEAKISLEVCFGQILFLSAVFVEFHSPNQGTLIPVPPSISPMGLQGLYPASLFLGTKCSIPHRPIHPMGNRVPNEKADVSWMCFPGSSGVSPIRRVLSPRNSWTFSFMLP